MRVRNVDSWNLGCGVLSGNIPPPRELSSSHSDPEDLVVGYHNSCPVDRKSKLREELRVRKAQTYAHLVQQVAVRARS